MITWAQTGLAGAAVSRRKAGDLATTRAVPDDRAAIVAAVCAEVAGGHTLRRVLDQPRRPTRKMLIQWLYADPALMTRYREARSFAADLLFEELEEAAEAATECQTMTEVAALRLKLDMQRWALSKRASKRYGERIEVEAENGPALATFTLGIKMA